MKNKINKAVIACGGLGTRFLPITKAIPKEMLPIVDTPVVAMIANEAVNAGADEILIILSRGKEAIREYFSPSSRLHQQLLKQGNAHLLSLLRNANINADIKFTYQERPNGSGDAIMCAQSFVKNAPFFVCFGDDLFLSPTPSLTQLQTAYTQNQANAVVGVKYISNNQIINYGTAKISPLNPQISQNIHNNQPFLCSGFVEKAPFNQIPSHYAIVGRYIFDQTIFKQLNNTPYVGNELRLTDAINNLCNEHRVFAQPIEGKRFDCGSKLGTIQASIEYALNQDFAPQLKQYLTELVKNFD